MLSIIFILYRVNHLSLQYKITVTIFIANKSSQETVELKKELRKAFNHRCKSLKRISPSILIILCAIQWHIK